MKDAKQNWERYMEAWSVSDSTTMQQELQAVLSQAVRYIDPVTTKSLEGAEAIQEYICQTQALIPGLNLQLVSFEQHHDVSLAQWNMCDGNGNVIAPGKSFARYNHDGKITETVAFFALPG